MPTTSPEELLQAASIASQNAHAPYSHFFVGAALLTLSGEVITGCNVENASFGLTQCAERVAIGRAIAIQHKTFTALAVVTAGDTLPYPCGACRQVLVEFCNKGFPIYVASAHNLACYETTSLGSLLPNAFKLN